MCAHGQAGTMRRSMYLLLNMSKVVIVLAAMHMRLCVITILLVLATYVGFSEERRVHAWRYWKVMHCL